MTKASIDHETAHALLLEAEYKFAKTMPWLPHWYTLAETWEDRAQFEAVVQFIRDNGKAEPFGKRTFVYYYLGDHKYWTMGSPLPITKLINRAQAVRGFVKPK